MKLLTVLVLPLCGVLASVSQDKTYQNSISALISPNLCQLKLICAISNSQNAKLLDSIFMRGITAISAFSQLTPVGNTTDAQLLSQSIAAGETGLSCTSLAPRCPYSERELIRAMTDLGIVDEVSEKHVSRVKRQYGGEYRREYRRPQRNPHRRQQSVLSRMPPIFRPKGAEVREVCRTCDVRGNVCSVYSIGTFVGCTGALLMAGPPAQVVCNVVTTPGSIGCGMNSLHCFMESCGFIRLPGV